MAFLNLRTNNLVYVLYKEATPRLEVGKVINVSPPTPRLGSMYNDLIVDIQVEINGMTTSFLKLPANANIADFGNNMVVACLKDTMSDEITTMRLRSQDVINSVDLHKCIIRECDNILLSLNPEIAEKLKQDAENKALRKELNELKDLFKDFMKSHENC